MKSARIRKVLSLVMAFTLILQQAGFAQGIAQLNISRYIGAFSGPSTFRPLQLRYFSYDPLTDNFRILLDKGDLKKTEDNQIKTQGQELLKYFLVGVALPDENFWVNLRPDSENQIISPALARTDLGKVLLEADLQLKKDVARFTSPQTAEGREYWNKLYQKAGQIFGSENITIPTLTRPWIVPGEVIIRETQDSAYVYKATLKVMLEQDHLKNSADYKFSDPRLKELNEYSSQIIRDKIIPKLTKEVNSSAKYAGLRQVFFSLILSRWFKHKFAGQDGLYPRLINTGNLKGLTSQAAWSKTAYFKEYQKSFNKGEYNIREQVSTVMGPVIRTYFSGGVALGNELKMPIKVEAGSPLSTYKGGNTRVTDALGNKMLAVNGNAADGEIEIAKAFGYGFAGTPGMTLAHDKVFKVKAAIAFSEGRAVGIFGNGAENLDEAAAKFLEKSGEVGVSKEEVVNNLKEDRGFLNAVLDDAFLDRVIETIAKTVKTEKETPFMQLIKQIASIPDTTTRIAQARKALVEDTRFIAFLFGEKGVDPYLFSVGNILSKEYRALVAHIGTFPYTGSENIKGGSRTIYTALARIEGFSDLGKEGVESYREMMLHEFIDLAAGKHIEPSPEVVAALNKINTEIDKNYRDVVKGVATEVTEEGSVVVTTPKVTIEKYRLVTDLGKKDTFAILGQSKVHPEVIKGKGQKITVTIAKADTGSIGGHGTSPGLMLEGVAEEWMKAAERGEVLSFFITRVGDDISVTVTHVKGKDNRRIHELIWDGFVRGGVIAKDMGFYAAGQDLLADAFSGNVRGAGPSVAEMEFLEAGSEVLITGQADKTAPGAFNQGLWRILFGPSTTWRPLGKGQAGGIKVGMLDFDYNNSLGRHIWWQKGDYDDAYWYMGFPDRYTVDSVTLANGEDVAAVTAQRLGKIAGKYTGKDDPMFMIRAQSAFPAVGEISSAFLVGEYFVPGWMRGSNKGPFFPVSLMDAKIGIYDGPPLLAMWSFNINNGRLVGFYDLMAANPAVRYVQDRRAAAAVRQLEEGFHEMALRLGPEEIEYQEGPALMEKRLSGRWEEFKEKDEKASSAITAQRQADGIHEDVAQKVALQKTQAIQAALQKEFPASSAILSNPENLEDASLRSASMPDTGKKGGIDFRSIPVITQPMGNLSGLNFSLPKLSNLKNINLDEEFNQIQKMLAAGITPSGERLKEYVAACYQKGELKLHMDEIVASLVDTCRLEEERVTQASNELKELMLILDSAS